MKSPLTIVFHGLSLVLVLGAAYFLANGLTLIVFPDDRTTKFSGVFTRHLGLGQVMASLLLILVVVFMQLVVLALDKADEAPELTSMAVWK